MFPFKDYNSVQRKPIVNWFLIGSCVGIYLLMQQGTDQETYAVYTQWGMVPDLGLVSVGLVGYQFIHGSFTHLLGNMVFLWIFGDNIEDTLGRGRYLLFYLLSGVGSGVAYATLNSDSSIPLIGASGSISGVMAAYLLRFPRVKILLIAYMIPIRLPAFVLLLFWLGRDIYGFLLADPGNNIAYSGHLGGFAAGLVLFLLLGGMRKRKDATSQTVIVKGYVGKGRRSIDV